MFNRPRSYRRSYLMAESESDLISIAIRDSDVKSGIVNPTPPVVHVRYHGANTLTWNKHVATMSELGDSPPNLAGDCPRSTAPRTILCPDQVRLSLTRVLHKSSSRLGRLPSFSLIFFFSCTFFVFDSLAT